MTLNALAEAQGRPGFPMSALMSEIESPYGVLPCNLNKDLKDMDPKVLAERRAKQNARRAGLVAPTSSAVPPPPSVGKAPETPQANPALTLAQACPQGPHPGESSAPG
ncbi:hypothetical protein COLO4_33424 [Corchorus olitorius]|uniref:Uncharacterized protein n=1 Tax=Corchorus olitorius TaxID=93759 RepID=A0A1R3GTN2_9ROSI|nr:hypothetical protein COLO4_33424 [Corchorus olitorius]